MRRAGARDERLAGACKKTEAGRDKRNQSWERATEVRGAFLPVPARKQKRGRGNENSGGRSGLGRCLQEEKKPGVRKKTVGGGAPWPVPGDRKRQAPLQGWGDG